MKRAAVNALVLAILALLLLAIGGYAAVQPTRRALLIGLEDMTGFELDGKENIRNLDTPKIFFDDYNQIIKNCMKVNTDEKCVCGELQTGYLREGDFIVRNFYKDGVEYVNTSLMYEQYSNPQDYKKRIGNERFTDEYEAKYCAYFSEEELNNRIYSENILVEEMTDLGMSLDEILQEGITERSMIKIIDEDNRLEIFTADGKKWQDLLVYDDRLRIVRLKDGTICNSLSPIADEFDSPKCEDSINVLEIFDDLIDAITESLIFNQRVEFFRQFPVGHEVVLENIDQGLMVTLQYYPVVEQMQGRREKVVLAEHLFEDKKFIMYDQEILEDQFIFGKWTVEDTELEAEMVNNGYFFDLALEGETILRFTLSSGIIHPIFPQIIEENENWDVFAEEVQEYFSIYEDLDLVFEKPDLGANGKNCELKEWLGLQENFCILEAGTYKEYSFNREHIFDINFLNLTTPLEDEEWYFSMSLGYEYFFNGNSKGDASRKNINSFKNEMKYKFNTFKHDNLGTTFVFVDDKFYDTNEDYLTIMGFDDGR